MTCLDLRRRADEASDVDRRRSPLRAAGQGRDQSSVVERITHHNYWVIGFVTTIIVYNSSYILVKYDGLEFLASLPAAFGVELANTDCPWTGGRTGNCRMRNRTCKSQLIKKKLDRIRYRRVAAGSFIDGKLSGVFNVAMCENPITTTI